LSSDGGPGKFIGTAGDQGSKEEKSTKTGQKTESVRELHLLISDKLSCKINPESIRD
jgi:hypothetical protein